MVDKQLGGTVPRIRDVDVRTWWFIPVALTCAIAYVMWRPVSNNVILYPVLLSIAGIAGIVFWRSGRQVDRRLLPPLWFWLAFVAYAIVVAVARDAEYWIRTLVFFLFWPLVFSVMVLGFRRRVIPILFWCGAIVTIVVSVVFVLGALARSGALPVDKLPEWIVEPSQLRVSMDSDGIITLSAHALPPLLWWGPMWLASLFCRRDNPYLPPTWLRALAAGMALAGAIIAWRRAIVVVIVLAPALLVIAYAVLVVRNRVEPPVRLVERPSRYVLGVVGALVLAVGVGFSVQTEAPDLVGRGVSSIAVTIGIAEPPEPVDLSNLSANPSSETTIEDDRLADAIRQNEWRALTRVDGAADLLVGRGIGAAIDRGAADREMREWQTELQYHMLFYTTGLVGLALLAAVGVASLRVVRAAFRADPTLRGVLFVSVVGALATLAGNATNPYMQAPGHMWPVFLPFMLAAVMFRRQQHERDTSGPGASPASPAPR